MFAVELNAAASPGGEREVRALESPSTRTSSDHHARAALHPDERDLFRAMDAVEEGDLSAAIQTLEALLARNSAFAAARLVHGDLLTLQSGRPVSADSNSSIGKRRLRALRDELSARLRHRAALPLAGHVPAPLVQLSGSQRRAIVVDVSASRLYLLEHGSDGLRVALDYYVSTGKHGPNKVREGDKRTPLGVYFVTTRLPPERLSDFYGAGALPINYPNEWDLRLGRTGHGIWVHGVPSDMYSRPPQASDGCMALPNTSMRTVWEMSDAGRTPVVIAERLEWISSDAMAARRDQFLQRFEAWRTDWESLNEARYGSHYSDDFAGDQGVVGRDLWLARRGRLIRTGGEALASSEIRGRDGSPSRGEGHFAVLIDDVSVFAYPGEQDMVVVSFDQRRSSPDRRESSRRRQYWRLESDGQWRIVYEGQARFLPVHRRGIPFSALSKIALDAD